MTDTNPTPGARPNPFDLTGKVAVVTGGNGGIGLAMAEGLARAGATVAVVGRDAAKTERAAAGVAAGLGVATLPVVADVADEGQVERAIAAVLDRFGRLDVLINNAGVTVRTPPEAQALDDWRKRPRRQPDRRLPDVEGRLPCAQAGRRRQDHQHRQPGVDLRRAVRAELRREQGGRRPAHQEPGAGLGPRQHPGQRHPARLVRDRHDRRARRAVAGLHERVLARTPQGRWGQPVDIAGTAVWLAAPASDFVTGAAVPVDGGFSAAL